MTIRVTSLSEVDNDTVEQAQAAMTQLLSEKYPDIDLTRGVIHDIACFLAGGVVNGVVDKQLEYMNRSKSLLAISTEPALADETLLDHILSNWLITRSAGTAAVGEVAIVISANVPVVVPAGTIFTQNNVRFRTTYPIVARPKGNATIIGTDKTLAQTGPGRYEFTVPAVCETSGEVGNIRINAAMSLSGTLPNFVQAYASSDFTGGTASESVTELIARLQKSIPAPVAAGGDNLVSLLRRTYPAVANGYFSVVGFGDAEQKRDRYSLFPFSAGNRVDIYAKTALAAITTVRTKQVTLVSFNGLQPVWQFTVDRGDVPGFYFVSGIKLQLTDDSVVNLNASSIERGVRFQTDEMAPEIPSPVEGAFSAYQTAIVSFFGPETAGLSVGTTRSASVAFTYQPYIEDLQNLVNQPSHRMWGGDVLVKAAVPCVVSVAIELVQPAGNSTPDVAAIRDSVSRVINRLDFTGVLYASQLMPAITAAIPSDTLISNLTMSGVVYLPDGRIRRVAGSTQLNVPDDPAALVTSKTTAFFCYSDDVTVDVLTKV